MGKLSEEQMRATLAAAGWPEWLVPQALAVTWCESRYGPGSLNPSGPYYGLFQLAAFWFPYFGESLDAWSDPIVNARVAYGIYQRDGWGPWGCAP